MDYIDQLQTLFHKSSNFDIKILLQPPIPKQKAAFRFRKAAILKDSENQILLDNNFLDGCCSLDNIYTSRNVNHGLGFADRREMVLPSTA